MALGMTNSNDMIGKTISRTNSYHGDGKEKYGHGVGLS
jgi:hypothetical protein